MLENTLVLIKPGVLHRQILGKIISRIEDLELYIIALKMLKASKKTCRKHFRNDRKTPIFPKLVNFLSSEPIICLVVYGNDAIKK